MSADALIFIPGIKGTKLAQTNRPDWDVIWSGFQSNFESINDLELSRAHNGKFYDESIDTIILPHEIEKLAYGEFLRDLKTDKPVYIFNYDWRLPASENGKRLAEYIDYLTEKSQAANQPIASFDFVTHSLGNFVLRNYLKTCGFARVHKIVFTVPPFRGSLDIVSAVLIGEGVFPNVKAKIRKLIRTFPGALELLASYTGASRFSTNPRSHNLFELDHWQENIRKGDTPAKRAIAKKFEQALAFAKATVDDGLLQLDRLSKDQRDRILVIVRGGFETYQSMRVIRQISNEPRNFFGLEKAVRTTDGDGRVPHVSSCCFHDSVKTLLLEDGWFYKEYSHGFILKDERVQKLVNRFLYSPKFSSSIPGGSIKRVTGLRRRTKNNEPYWQAEFK
ncbi:MAG: hypothetical protein HOI66_18960 [Verrucomicrobia bacterium]|jgi:hypothetical protein|nr:hypothetical protein [Verrucomicrobiota bacterium]